MGSILEISPQNGKSRIEQKCFLSDCTTPDQEAVKKLNFTVISNPDGVRNLVFKSEISRPLRGLEMTKV